MPRPRRSVLRAAGALGGLALAPGVSAGEPGPPKEAYQPDASKNWWYCNGHLYEDGDARFDYSVAIIADHGGDAAGHLLLFTLVDYETGETVATNLEGVVEPSVERYAATFTGPDASARVERTGARPFTFELAVSASEVDLALRYETAYDRKTREGYPEGGGVGNVLFWNQARCSGTVSTGDGETSVEGVGFLEHVWGTWSRAPQKGIDFLNGHLGRPGEGSGPPTRASVYFRRTFYHGTPASGPIREDVGPVLYLSRDGRTWYAATDVTCTFDGEPCAEHRTGTPESGRIRGQFADGGRLDVTFDQRQHATVSIPGEEPLGNVHEGAASLSGAVCFPDERRRRPIGGIAQTEHQRFGPRYEY